MGLSFTGEALPDIRTSWQWTWDELSSWQLQTLNQLLATILPGNRLYRQKLGTETLQLRHLDQLADLPLTTKSELVTSAAEDSQGISGHHTFPADAYSRVHRTSGTTGNPLMVLDTADDWRRWSWIWQHVLEAAEISPRDRVFLAFSFGPFIGFWSAHQACVDRGAAVIPGGGLSSLARLEFMRQSRANVVCCTPSYALYLAHVAEQEGFPLRQLGIERLVVAGESGGSIPSVRARIEQAWQASVVDHSGATEIGPWGFGWPEQPGLHVIEAAFIAELLPVETVSNQPQESDEDLRELVLTSLLRSGAPVLRYRTGDVVRSTRPDTGPCRFLWLPDGVVGRADSMVTIRGVNMFPSSIDALVREMDSIDEYRVVISHQDDLDQLRVDIEAPDVETPAEARAELEKRFNTRLGLRIPVHLVEPGSLPRSEGKSRRWQDERRR